MRAVRFIRQITVTLAFLTRDKRHYACICLGFCSLYWANFWGNFAKLKCAEKAGKGLFIKSAMLLVERGVKRGLKIQFRVKNRDLQDKSVTKGRRGSKHLKFSGTCFMNGPKNKFKLILADLQTLFLFQMMSQQNWRKKMTIMYALSFFLFSLNYLPTTG